MNLRTLIRLKTLSKGKKKEKSENTTAVTDVAIFASPETDPAGQAKEPVKEMRP